MQIFVKTLTGKTITMEVETESHEVCAEHIIYLNYTSKSHVLTGKPSDALREQIKSLKLATYHPRLYPQGKGGQPSEKGWLIKADKLEEVKELLKKGGCEPKIVLFKNTIARMFEDVGKLTSVPENSDEPETSDSSSDFDESLANPVKQVSKEEKAAIIEEIKGCLVSPEPFNGVVLPSGIGYETRETSAWDFCIQTFPGDPKTFFIGHNFKSGEVGMWWLQPNGNKTFCQMPYGEQALEFLGTLVIPTRAALKTFLEKYYSKANNLAKFRLHQAISLFEEKGDPEGVFAKKFPELWDELVSWTV